MATEFEVTFESADPAAHAAFWARALHYVQAPTPPGFGRRRLLLATGPLFGS